MYKIKIFLLILGLLIFNRGNSYAQKISKVDSLKQILVDVSDKEKSNILNQLCWKLRNSLPEEALKYGKKSIILAQKYENGEELAKAYGFSGVAYRNLGSYSEAFDHYFKGLEASRKYKIKEQEGYALINIGNLYIYQESYDDAIEYLANAVTIASEINNESMSAYCNLNLGRTLLLKNHFEKSLNYLHTALKKRIGQNDSEGIAVCYKYLGDAYLGQEMLDSAYVFYNDALEKSNKLSDSDLISNIYGQLAKIYFLKNYFSQSQAYAEKSLNVALLIHNKLGIRDAYQILYDINVKAENYKAAAEYSHFVVLYNDSLFNQTLSQKISSIKFNTTQISKQAEIDFLNKKNEISKNDLKRERNFQTVLLIILLIMAGIVVLSLILRNKLKKNNKELNKQQVINDLQQKELQKVLKKQKELNEKLSDENKTKTNRATLADIVEDSLDNTITLNEFLQNALESILNISWLSVRTQGAIFLANKAGNLEMIAKKDIGDHRIKACSLVKPGECICGQAFAEKKPYIGDFRSKFEKDENTIPYIHMKMPIILAGKVNGLLNLYLEKEKGIKEQDIRFFESVCSSLANIITQKQLQVELKKHENEQNILNQQLFAQSLEVDQRNVEIESANTELKNQKDKITKQHKDITDSINYAKTIQQALLTRPSLIEQYLPEEHFIFFKPKEAVSGDFYYVNKLDNNLVFAAADCTGHGVPGGFLTVLGITFLHGIVSRLETNNPASALTILRNRVKEVFRSSEKNNKNGLDIALCSIDTETHILQFAGAYNPLWIMRGNELLEYKATSNPIGFYPKEKEFENHTIELQDNDKIYIFSDGYVDQIGGDKRRKFMKRKFRELIKTMSSKPMKEQNEILKTTLDEWQGDFSQIDDIIVMGLTYNYS